MQFCRSSNNYSLESLLFAAKTLEEPNYTKSDNERVLKKLKEKRLQTADAVSVPFRKSTPKIKKCAMCKK